MQLEKKEFNSNIVPFVEDQLRPRDVMAQIYSIQQLMTEAMKVNEHYGIIPGTSKNTLYKAGAEKLDMMFRLAPEYEVERIDLPNNHREYIVKCRLIHINTGKMWGMGVGSCSTMESKYRYRNVADYEVTGEPIPKDAKERKKEYRKQGYGMKKIDGVWEWVKYTDSQKTENPDIADVYNTVLKMAKKRAQVDATLTATAASDIFTQDMPNEYGIEEPAYEFVPNKPVDNKTAETHTNTAAEQKKANGDASNSEKSHKTDLVKKIIVNVKNIAMMELPVNATDDERKKMNQEVLQRVSFFEFEDEEKNLVTLQCNTPKDLEKIKNIKRLQTIYGKTKEELKKIKAPKDSDELPL